LKEATTFASGESMPENGNDGAEKNLNGQAHLMAMQHKADQPVSITTPAIRDVREPSASVTLENVVQQVKDHLTSRDIKAGTEQVSIRLTPEHMGELKLNMTMENRQLKVEIVAESGMVRDTLLKHADSLRETLAKQNITVESFNVTTGGDRNPSGRDQSDWRELARQQQQNLWMSSGGYRVPKPAAPVMAAMYQSSSNNSMLDIHY
jgi:flagellar hook-length control protein FliK